MLGGVIIRFRDEMWDGRREMTKEREEESEREVGCGVEQFCHLRKCELTRRESETEHRCRWRRRKRWES